MPLSAVGENVTKSSNTRPTYVYRLFGSTGELLYIGCTRKLDQRLRAHERLRADVWPSVCRMTVDIFTDRYQAEDAERTAILRERPRWNRQQWHPSPRVPDEAILEPTLRSVEHVPETIRTPHAAVRDPWWRRWRTRSTEEIAWRPVEPPKPAGRKRSASAHESRVLVWSALVDIGKPTLVRDIAAHAGRSDQLVRARLAELVELGVVTRTGHGRWIKFAAVVTPDGRPDIRTAEAI
jgi:predicted GIY-YIG superfamily endonuclease